MFKYIITFAQNISKIVLLLEILSYHLIVMVAIICTPDNYIMLRIEIFFEHVLLLHSIFFNLIDFIIIFLKV